MDHDQALEAEADVAGARAAPDLSSGRAQPSATAAAAGEQVAFGAASPSRELVGHELAHVVQQREGRAPRWIEG